MKVLTACSKRYEGNMTEYARPYESLEPVKKVVVAGPPAEANKILKRNQWADMKPNTVLRVMTVMSGRSFG